MRSLGRTSRVDHQTVHRNTHFALHTISVVCRAKHTHTHTHTGSSAISRWFKTSGIAPNAARARERVLTAESDQDESSEVALQRTRLRGLCALQDVERHCKVVPINL